MTKIREIVIRSRKCACGCGKYLASMVLKIREHTRFILGHNSGAPKPWLRKKVCPCGCGKYPGWVKTWCAGHFVRRGRRFSVAHRMKISISRKRLFKRGVLRIPRGSDNWGWRGGHRSFRGKDWKEQREKALVRSGSRCEAMKNRMRCHVRGRSRLHVHHKIPYRITKDNRMKNLRVLCRSHHFQQDSHWINERNPFHQKKRVKAKEAR